MRVAAVRVLAVPFPAAPVIVVPVMVVPVMVVPVPVARVPVVLEASPRSPTVPRTWPGNAPAAADGVVHITPEGQR